MKAILKKTALFRYYVKLRQKLSIIKYFAYFCKKHAQYCMDTCCTCKGEEARLTAMYHVLEKGLTMPERRLGFGQPMVLQTIQQLQLVHKLNNGVYSDVCHHALAVLSEYYHLHQREHFPLESSIESALESILATANITSSAQIESSPEEYWRHLNADFAKFSASRHSVRNFGKTPVSMKQIQAAVELANNSPSACNRQPWKVYCVADNEKRAQLLQLQGGNRGFGQFADKALVITCDRSSFYALEGMSLYVNGGIYLMNLSYALHYNKVAHCILGMPCTAGSLRKIHKLIGIPDSESIIALMVCGTLAEHNFPLAISPRKNVEDSLVVI